MIGVSPVVTGSPCSALVFDAAAASRLGVHHVARGPRARARRSALRGSRGRPIEPGLLVQRVADRGVDLVAPACCSSAASAGTGRRRRSPAPSPARGRTAQPTTDRARLRLRRALLRARRAGLRRAQIVVRRQAQAARGGPRELVRAAALDTEGVAQARAAGQRRRQARRPRSVRGGDWVILAFRKASACRRLFRPFGPAEQAVGDQEAGPRA